MIELIRPPSAGAFADRFASLVESSNPVALFRFSYCLPAHGGGTRRRVRGNTVRSICPPQSRAVRFLKVHSNAGSDGTHVDEQLLCFESLTQQELELIIGAAFEHRRHVGAATGNGSGVNGSGDLPPPGVCRDRPRRRRSWQLRWSHPQRVDHGVIPRAFPSLTVSIVGRWRVRRGPAPRGGRQGHDVPGIVVPIYLLRIVYLQRFAIKYVGLYIIWNENPQVGR